MLLRFVRIVVWERPRGLYVRVPKVANTSVRHGFGKGRERRACIALLRRRYPGHLTFSFVRNPWARLVSTYRNKILDEKVTNSHYQDGVHRGFVKRGLPFRAGMPFEEFVELVCAFPDTRTEKHLKSQSHFLVHRGRVVPEFIGRLETIARDWRALCERLGVEAALVHYNRTAGAPYQSYYTPRVVNLVGDRYREDIVRFGYEFDAHATGAARALGPHAADAR